MGAVAWAIQSHQDDEGLHLAFPILRRCSAEPALRDLVAVGASPGARAVVLHRVGPAGSGISGRRNGVDDGKRESESQSNFGQHGHSPRIEARNGSLCNDLMVESGKRFGGFAMIWC
jgi:hypothetical protein